MSVYHKAHEISDLKQFEREIIFLILLETSLSSMAFNPGNSGDGEPGDLDGKIWGGRRQINI